MSSSNVIIFSWDDISRIVHNIGIQAEKYPAPEIIVAIQRGGLIPAVLLSHMLNIRDFVTIDIRVTANDSVNSLKQHPILNCDSSIEKIKNKRIMLVDDIIGSGLTYKAAYEYIKLYSPLNIQSYMCVINKANWLKYNGTSPLPNITYIDKEVYGWVKFPWER